MCLGSLALACTVIAFSPQNYLKWTLQNYDYHHFRDWKAKEQRGLSDLHKKIVARRI